MTFDNFQVEQAAIWDKSDENNPLKDDKQLTHHFAQCIRFAVRCVKLLEIVVTLCQNVIAMERVWES